MKTKFLFPAILVAFLTVSATVEKKHPLINVEALKDYVEIPEGEVSISSERYQVQRFFIAKYEVTNGQYQEFLQALKEKDDPEALSAAQIKSNNWQKINAVGNIEEIYHTHAAFANSPVVNVSFEGAQRYCQWLTEKVNRETPANYTVEFRLPTREEWIRAARGETNNRYAWDSPYLTDSKGYFLCNFKKLGPEQIHFNKDKSTYEIVKLYDGPDATLTDKVGTYAPNIFGVYDMCGNVAEMIADEGKAVGGSFDASGYDVRVESLEEYQDVSPLVGFRPILIVKE